MSAPLKTHNVVDRHVDNKTSCSTAVKSPDMKAMCALMGQLDALKQAAQTKQSTLQKYATPPTGRPKQGSSLKKCSRRPKKPARENDVKNKGNIRDWLVSEAKKPMGVDRTCKVSHSHRRKIRSPEKDDMLSMYLKYGVKVPSFESIMKQCKETEEYRKTLEENKLQPIAEFPDYKTHLANLKKTKTQEDEKLDCKHLTLDEVRDAVRRNMAYAAKIQSEEVYCERHTTFYKQQRGSNFDQFVELVGCDTSTEAFTDEHIREMLRMLVREFGDKAQYYLVVLLPELCLKIFMEVHNMSYDEAVKYLEERRYNDDSDSE